MLATAEDIPPELFERILDFAVGDVGMTKRELGMCALTCTYWADKVQPRIFDHITLRSGEDVRTLASFFESEYSRVAEYLEFLVLEQHGHAKPWFHLAAVVLMPQLLGLNITISIDDTYPHNAKWPLRSIHGALPRVTPAFNCNIRELTLADVRFRKFTDLMDLVSEVPQLGTLTCKKLLWPKLGLDVFEFQDGAGRLPPLGRLARNMRSVIVDGCADALSPIWFFIGRNRLIPRAMEHAAEIRVHVDDALAAHDILCLFLDVINTDKSSPESSCQIMFHRSGDGYSLVYSELVDEDSAGESADLHYTPDISFTFSRPPRRAPLPFGPDLPAPIVNNFYVTSVTLDFHMHALDEYRYTSYDWKAFDNLSASLTHLDKVVFGFHDESELRRFTSTETSISTVDPELEPDLELELVQNPSTRTERLLEMGKARYAYWNVKREGWMRVTTEEDTDSGPILDLSDDLENI